MLVRLYDVDKDGNETFRAQCDHAECFDNADDAARALDTLRRDGRYWAGGGAAPLVLLMRAS